MDNCLSGVVAEPDGRGQSVLVNGDLGVLGVLSGGGEVDGGAPSGPTQGRTGLNNVNRAVVADPDGSCQSVWGNGDLGGGSIRPSGGEVDGGAPGGPVQGRAGLNNIVSAVVAAPDDSCEPIFVHGHPWNGSVSSGGRDVDGCPSSTCGECRGRQ